MKLHIAQTHLLYRIEENISSCMGSVQCRKITSANIGTDTQIFHVLTPTNVDVAVLGHFDIHVVITNHLFAQIDQGKIALQVHTFCAGQDRAENRCFGNNRRLMHLLCNGSFYFRIHETTLGGQLGLIRLINVHFADRTLIQGPIMITHHSIFPIRLLGSCIIAERVCNLTGNPLYTFGSIVGIASALHIAVTGKH